MIRSVASALVLIVASFVSAAELSLPALGGKPASPEALRGWTHFHDGNIPAGLDAFKSALEKHPADHSALYGQAVHALAMSDYQIALEKLCTAIVAAKDSAWGELYIREAANVLAYASDEKPFLDLCAKANTAGLRPHLHQLLLERQSDWLRQRGQFDAAKAAAKAMQPLARWALVGPFDNRDNAGFDTASAPETNLQFAEPVSGRNRNVTWFQPDAQPADGRIDLTEVFEPNDHVLAYAATFVESPESGWAVLRAAFSGAMSLWVNGSKVAEEKGLNEFGHDKIAVPVYIHKGWNQILVKTGLTDAQEWTFTVRLSKPDGAPLTLIKVDSSATALDAYKASGKRNELPPQPETIDLGLRAALDAELKRDASNPLVIAARAALLHWQNAGSREDNIDARELQRAIAFLPKSPFLKLRLATIAEDRNQARQATEAGLATHPDLPALHETLAILAIENGQNILASDIAAGVRKKFGAERSGAAMVVLAQTILAKKESENESLDINDSGGVTGKAFASRLLEEVVGRHPYLAEAWMRLIETQDTYGGRRAILKRALEKCGGDPALRAKQAEELALMEKDAEALALEKATLEQNPFDVGQALAVAKRAVSAGQDAQARDVLDAMRKNAPESASLLEGLAHAMTRAGEQSRAVELMREILRIKPNSPHVKDHLALLNVHPDDGQKFWAAYNIEFKDLSIPDIKAFPNDNAVNILNQTVVRVNPNGSTSRMVHYVGKVLRPAGIGDLSYHNIYYEPERQVVDILRAAVITPDGRELARADVQDRSTSAMAGVQTRIYDEHHLKQVSFKNLEPGSTIEIQYTIRDTGLNIYGDYFSDTFYLADENPTLRSQYVLDTPKSLEFQTRVFNTQLEAKPLETKEADRKAMVWELNNTPGIVRERNMPPAVDQIAQLQVTTMKSWQEVGQWYWNLARESLVPSEEMKATVAEITKNAKNDREKLRLIHDWVIEKIRYLGIEFGRNGYKPHRAADSFKALYGDCKDTAVLITSMLNVAGIDSRLVLIRTVDAGAVPENSLPMPNLFNHCIAYVPSVEGKDYWIDCTTDFHQLGELPYADERAQVLVVGQEGGKFVRIPQSPPSANLVEQIFSARVARDGSAAMKIRDVRHGQFAASYRELAETPGQYERFMREFAARRFNGAEVAAMSRAPRGEQGPMWMETELKVPQLATRSGERKALPASLDPLGLSNRFVGETQRRNDIDLYFPWKRVTETVYDLDASLTVLSIPDEMELKEDFAHYVRKVSREAAKVIIKETFELSRPRVKAAEYEAFKSFCNKVDGAAEQKVLLEVR